MSEKPATRPIMFVHPDADTKQMRRLLGRAGYVVVVTASPPEHFRVLPQVPTAPLTILGQAARDMFENAKFYGADEMRKDYALRVVKMLQAVEDLARAKP
jgi:hypothetical protein